MLTSSGYTVSFVCVVRRLHSFVVLVIKGLKKERTRDDVDEFPAGVAIGLQGIHGDERRVNEFPEDERFSVSVCRGRCDDDQLL